MNIQQKNLILHEGPSAEARLNHLGHSIDWLIDDEMSISRGKIG